MSLISRFLLRHLEGVMDVKLLRCCPSYPTLKWIAYRTTSAAPNKRTERFRIQTTSNQSDSDGLGRTIKSQIIFVYLDSRTPMRRPVHLRPTNIPMKTFARPSRGEPTGGPHGSSNSPVPSTVGLYVNERRAVRVSLELPGQRLIVCKFQTAKLPPGQQLKETCEKHQEQQSFKQVTEI